MDGSCRVDNGVIWTADSLRPLSLVLENGRILATPEPQFASQYPVEKVIDAKGLWILPGGVDLHVHISDGLETFLRGSCCAAAGGITTVLDMAPFHACVSPQQLIKKSESAQASCVVDFGLIAGIVVENDDLVHLQKLGRAGAAYFKVFQPAEPPVSAETLWKSVQAAARTGLRLGLHAEEPACLFPVGNSHDPLSFPRSRPQVAETSAVAQMLEMARAAGAPVHVCHVSCGRTADLVAWGKAHAVDITCEVPAHYLVLDETDFSMYGARVKTTPPLRTRTDTEQLWQALSNGVIDAIASDHYTESAAPLLTDPELIPGAPAGIAGLEVSLPLIMDAVQKGRLNLKRFVEASAEVPARLAGLSHRKGRLEVGMDADFVLWDPEEAWNVSPLGEFSRIETTPFNGWQLKGRIQQTWVRGQQVWDGREIRVPAGYGRWQKSKRGE